MENRKAGGAASRRVTKFDRAKCWRNIIMRERSGRASYSQTDRVRQMIRKLLRNIVPFPGNIGMFRKDPLCIMRKGGCLKRETGKRYLFRIMNNNESREEDGNLREGEENVYPRLVCVL